MTRQEAIEAIARAIDPGAFADDGFSDEMSVARTTAIRQAAAAYSALLPHIQGERKRVREMCADAVKSFIGSDVHDVIAGDLGDEAAGYCGAVAAGLSLRIRALDIGGQEDG